MFQYNDGTSERKQPTTICRNIGVIDMIFLIYESLSRVEILSSVRSGVEELNGRLKS